MSIKVLHETVGIVTVETVNAPRVQPKRRLQVTPLGAGIYRITVPFGYMQRPDIRRVLDQCRDHGVEFPHDDTTFFVGRETLKIGRKSTMARWRKLLFLWMSRTAHDISAHFQLPAGRVIEVGVQLEI